MLVLALDTATPAVTTGLVAVVTGSGAGEDGDRPGLEVLEQRVVVDGRRHGELLAPLIQECLAAAGLSPGDLDAVVAGTGPGPFTGLRVGLVTAAALGDALEIPVHGVCSLDAVAVAVRQAADGVDGDSVVVTDARRREVYWAAYRDGVRVAGPFVDRPAALADRFAEVARDAGAETGAESARVPWRPRWATGAGAELYAEVVGLPVRRGGARSGSAAAPTAAGLVACAADRLGAGGPAEPLTPLYLRRPDAVEPTARRPAVGREVPR